VVAPLEPAIPPAPPRLGPLASGRGAAVPSCVGAGIAGPAEGSARGIIGNELSASGATGGIGCSTGGGIVPPAGRPIGGRGRESGGGAVSGGMSRSGAGGSRGGAGTVTGSRSGGALGALGAGRGGNVRTEDGAAAAAGDRSSARLGRFPRPATPAPIGTDDGDCGWASVGRALTTSAEAGARSPVAELSSEPPSLSTDADSSTPTMKSPM